MSSSKRFCLVEDHKPCQVLPSSMAHGPTSLPSIFRVAATRSSLIEIFSTGPPSLSTDGAHQPPNLEKLGIRSYAIDRRRVRRRLRAETETACDDGTRRYIASETMGSSHDSAKRVADALERPHARESGLQQGSHGAGGFQQTF